MVEATELAGGILIEILLRLAIARKGTLRGDETIPQVPVITVLILTDLVRAVEDVADLVLVHCVVRAETTTPCMELPQPPAVWAAEI